MPWNLYYWVILCLIIATNTMLDWITLPSRVWHVVVISLHLEVKHKLWHRILVSCHAIVTFVELRKHRSNSQPLTIAPYLCGKSKCQHCISTCSHTRNISSLFSKLDWMIWLTNLMIVRYYLCNDFEWCIAGDLSWSLTIIVLKFLTRS